MKIHYMVQKSPDWWEMRRGKVSASEANRILTPNGAEPKFSCVADDGETCGTKHGKRDAADKCAAAKGKKGKAFAVVECPLEMAAGHDSYIDQLIADTIHFDPNMMTERPVSRAIEEGNRREPDSRQWYERRVGRTVTQVGGCETADGLLWCSPDGLVGEEGGLELKNCDLATHVSYLRGGVIPAEYVPQVHTSLIVTGYKWWDWVSYHPACHAQLVIRTVPDEFTAKLRVCLATFLAKYAEAKAKVLQMP